MFDGENFTIQLPTDKVSKITDMLHKTIKQKTATLNQLEKIQGKLVHASIGLPGGRGLLSPIYRAVALQKPITRNYTYEYLFHKLLGHVGLININYFFIVTLRILMFLRVLIPPRIVVCKTLVPLWTLPTKLFTFFKSGG